MYLSVGKRLPHRCDAYRTRCASPAAAPQPGVPSRSTNRARTRGCTECSTVQIADVQAEPGYSDPSFPPALAPRTLPRSRAHERCLPSRCSKESELVGVIAIYRQLLRLLRRNRLGWCRISAVRPSSQSNIVACATSCANLCSSRLPPPSKRPFPFDLKPLVRHLFDSRENVRSTRVLVDARRSGSGLFGGCPSYGAASMVRL